MLKQSKKQSERRETFRKIGEALRDYHSGQESQFAIACRAVQDKDLSSRTGPKMKTQQWERTLKS